MRLLRYFPIVACALYLASCSPPSRTSVFDGPLQLQFSNEEIELMEKVYRVGGNGSKNDNLEVCVIGAMVLSMPRRRTRIK